MSEVWFAVTNRHGHETPQLYHCGLPVEITSPKLSQHVVYKLRLDTLPDAERWLKMSLNELMNTYRLLRERAKLPQAPPPPAAEPRKEMRELLSAEELAEGARQAAPLLAYRAAHPELGPYALMPRETEIYPYPVPDDVRLRPDAPGFCSADETA